MQRRGETVQWRVWRGNGRGVSKATTAPALFPRFYTRRFASSPFLFLAGEVKREWGGKTAKTSAASPPGENPVQTIFSRWTRPSTPSSLLPLLTNTPILLTVILFLYRLKGFILLCEFRDVNIILRVKCECTVKSVKNHKRKFTRNIILVSSARVASEHCIGCTVFMNSPYISIVHVLGEFYEPLLRLQFPPP